MTASHHASSTPRNIYPLTFEPILVNKVWGGRSLEQWGKTLPARERVGESWEIADLPDSIANGRSVIAHGPLAGSTLRDAIAVDPDAFMGSSTPSPEGGFPLLIKFLDARENLSVQVHPDAEYAAAHEDAHLKSEAWVVLEADDNAVIYKGVKPGIDAETFRTHIDEDTVVDDLITIPVKAGDCHYLPSGTCHALGEGILVAEVQTPSDTTFRVYDWGRTDRTLHIDESLACIDFNDPGDPPPSPVTLTHNNITTTELTATDFFTIERLDIDADTTLEVVTSGQPVIWIVLAGSVALSHEHAPSDISRGTTILFPAAISDTVATLPAGTSILRVCLPSPARNLLA